MSLRRVNIVLLCEDLQHESFVTRFLKRMGWDTRNLRVEKSPSARGSAEQWVRGRFPNELKAYRQRRQRAASALIAVIDADLKEVQGRINELADECTSQDVQPRGDKDAVALVVPKRNIETWIRYLNGEMWNETDAYPKLGRERDCRLAVDRLVGLCRSGGLPSNAPPALLRACDEYADRIRPLSVQK